MTVLTPMLFIGECPDQRHVHAEDARTAFNLIKDDYVVALPEGEWAMAEEVLRRLGLNESEIADRVHFGLTGQVATQKPPDERGASEGEEF